MIPKPLQFLLLAPLAFGTLAPKFFVGVFALGLAALAAFLWSMKSDQYDDLEGASWRIIADDDADT